MKTAVLSVIAAISTMFVAVAPAAAQESSLIDNAFQAFGTVQVKSLHSFDDTWQVLLDDLEANPNIAVVKTVDHAAAAASIGLELAPNRVVFFGNPALGTPLMQANQTAGLDLPQKIQVRQDDAGRVLVSYNDPTYLQARHQLGDVATLNIIAGALRGIVTNAAGQEPSNGPNFSRMAGVTPGLVTATSDSDVDTTWDRLLAAIEASPASIVFTLDHQANAETVGLVLRPTRLVVFGNPALGTPLMQRSGSAGIDLPLKILVWQDADGVTQVTTNDVRFVAARHRLSGVRDTLEAISGAIGNFVMAATTS